MSAIKILVLDVSFFYSLPFLTLYFIWFSNYFYWFFFPFVLLFLSAFLFSSRCSLSIILFHFLLASGYIVSCKIIYLRVTNLFEISNYLFVWRIKLFGHVDSSVRDIYFLLFIIYKQIFMLFNVLCAVHYYLFGMFKFFFIKMMICSCC